MDVETNNKIIDNILYCVCGCKFRKYDIKRHYKTKTHQIYIKVFNKIKYI